MNPQDIKRLEKSAKEMASLIRKMAPAIMENIKKANPEELQDIDIEELDADMNKHVQEVNKELSSLDEKIKRINGNIH